MKKFDSHHITKTLKPFVTEHRAARIESVITHRLESISLAMESPSDLNNALAAIRTSEALGISTVHIISAERDATLVRDVTKGAFYWVNIQFHETFEAFLSMIQSEKKRLAGAIVNAKKMLSMVPVHAPLCILMGNETRGLSEAARNACDIPFSIPLCGMTESLNLSVAAAISLFDVSQRKRALLNNQTDLSENKISHLRAEFYLKSVSPRLAKNVLKNSFS